MLDLLHHFLRVIDLHRRVLSMGCVSGQMTLSIFGWGIRTCRHGLLLRPSGGVVFRRSALPRLSRLTNSKIGGNGENQEVKVLPSEQDLRLVRIKQVATRSVPGTYLGPDRAGAGVEVECADIGEVGRMPHCTE